MVRAHLSVVVALSLLLGCKREVESQAHAPAVAAAWADAGAGGAGRDAGAVERGPTWYRAVVRAADGVEVWFFLGVPAPGAAGQAVFKVGGHEVRSAATFDGKTLNIPLAVHQTAVEATVGQDQILRGSFTTSWRAWGASSLPLTATRSRRRPPTARWSRSMSGSPPPPPPTSSAALPPSSARTSRPCWRTRAPRVGPELPRAASQSAPPRSRLAVHRFGLLCWPHPAHGVPSSRISAPVGGRVTSVCRPEGHRTSTASTSSGPSPKNASAGLAE